MCTIEIDSSPLVNLMDNLRFVYTYEYCSFLRKTCAVSNKIQNDPYLKLYSRFDSPSNNVAPFIKVLLPS